MPQPEQRIEHLPGPHPYYYEMIMDYMIGPLMGAYDLRHVGAEVLSKTEGPCLVAPVHRSMLDIPAVAHAALEGSGTQVHCMAKQELWKVPGLGKIIEWGGGFPVDRDKITPPADITQHVEKLIEGNAAIVLFPEATRRSGPIVNLKDIRGVHVFAAKYGVPIVPVGISGTEKGDRGHIQVVFGDRIDVPPPGRGWTKVARVLQGEVTEAMQDAQDRAKRLRDQL